MSLEPKFGWILFDGTCGACSHYIGGKPNFYSKYGFGVAAQQDSWVKDQLMNKGFTIGKEICLLKDNGSLLQGADVYREIAKHIWWLKPLNVLSNLVILKSLFNLIYKLISKNRFRLSKIFKLTTKAKYKIT